MTSIGNTGNGSNQRPRSRDHVTTHRPAEPGSAEFTLQGALCRNSCLLSKCCWLRKNKLHQSVRGKLKAKVQTTKKISDCFSGRR